MNGFILPQKTQPIYKSDIQFPQRIAVGKTADSRFAGHSKRQRQRFLPCIEREKLTHLERFRQRDVQYIKAAAADGRTMSSRVLRRRTINGCPVDRVRDQAAALQISLHIRPGSAGLRCCENAAKYAECQGVPHLQSMQAGKRQWGDHGVNDALGFYAVGIVDVIRDEQTRVCVNAHGVLVAFQFARQEHQIRKNLVAKDATTSGGGVRPANAAFLFAVRRRLICRFDFVNMREEFPALSRRQCLHLLQNFSRTHR